MSPSGVLTTLVSFSGAGSSPSRGENPEGGLTQGYDGNFYGTTSGLGLYGGGTIFKMTPAGVITTLVDLSATTENGVTNLGANPQASLILNTDGNFYGTTINGGMGTGVTGYGTVFKVTPSGVLKTLASFGGTAVAPAQNRGASPWGGLIVGPDGNFYGTTNSGGYNNLGTVFQLTPSGVLTTLVDFTGTTGTATGSKPYGGLVLAPDGNLYGTTYQGGTANDGTVFELQFSGANFVNFVSMISFTGSGTSNKGLEPYCDLTVGQDGNLWGSTFGGGTYGGGTLFKIANTAGFYNNLTTVVNFSTNPTLQTGAVAGGNPRPTMITGNNDGNLYGILTSGSASNHYGEVFKISYNGVFTPLTLFSSNTVGSAPAAPLCIGSDGNLYGTASAGGANSFGNIFEVTPGGTLSTVIDFTGIGGTTNTGATPLGGLVLGNDNNFYGTTSAGGTGTLNLGTVFQLTPSGILTTLASFTGSAGSTRGSSPQGTLVQGNDNNFYGTTSGGGTGTLNLGTVFQITPAGNLTTLVSFTGTGSYLGSLPFGGLVKYIDGSFYGTTSSGGTGNGTIFKVTSSGAFTSLVSFSGSNAVQNNRGSNPHCTLCLASDGNFYGTTIGGGANNYGTIFRMDPTGNITTIFDFSNTVAGTYGASAFAGMAQGPDGNLYGTTTVGGSSSYGTLFQVNPVMNTFTTLYDFALDDTNGRPEAVPIIGPDGNLYGTTEGLITGLGEIYRVVMPGNPTISQGTVTPQGNNSEYVSFLVNARSTSTVGVNLLWGYDGVTFPNSIFITANLSGFSTTPLGASLNFLTPGTTYYYKVIAGGPGGTTMSPVYSFSTLAPPIAIVSTATNVGLTSAQFNGTVNAENYNTSVTFQYGTDGINFPIQVAAAQGTLTGNNPTAVSASVAGLTSGTTYYYRISATSAGGTSVSDVSTFSTLTPPVATVSAATFVGSQSAQFNGTVNAEGAPLGATVSFQYTSDPNFVLNVYTVGGSLGTVYGDTPVSVSTTISNSTGTPLVQGTTYYYRVMAQSAGGTGYSTSTTFSLEILSGFARQFPTAPASATGSLQVNLAPSGITPSPGWNFVGEQLWRASGSTAVGLTTGNYQIEYQTAPGYIQPPPETVSVTSGGSTVVVNRVYYPTSGGTVGGLSVVLAPSNLTTAQWNFYGQSTLYNSGDTVSNLSPGNYLIQCQPVSGQTTPAVSSVAVSGGATTLVNLTYTATTTPIGAQPALLPFSTEVDPTTPSLPYAFVGQIRSSVGSASGCVVQDRVVATAGHVVFDDGSLNYVTGLQWIFERSAGTYDPVPQTPQGFYVFDGYAAQRIEEDTPGVSSPASQNLDVAALYFLASAGGGGYSGYLASDAVTNEFLTSSDLMMLVGYPVDGITAANQGQMYATPAVNASFSQVPGTDSSGNPYRIYTTSSLTSVGGNSGGPLCVQYTDGNYYPAAIYLGGSAQTVVRSIDSAVVDLFNRAQVSGDGGANNTGGGIVQVNTPLSGSTFTTASLTVNIVGSSTATWALDRAPSMRSMLPGTPCPARGPMLEIATNFICQSSVVSWLRRSPTIPFRWSEASRTRSLTRTRASRLSHKMPAYRWAGAPPSAWAFHKTPRTPRLTSGCATA